MPAEASHLPLDAERRRRRPPRRAAAPAAGARRHPGDRVARGADDEPTPAARPRAVARRADRRHARARRRGRPAGPSGGAVAGAPRDPVHRQATTARPSCASGCIPDQIHIDAHDPAPQRRGAAVGPSRTGSCAGAPATTTSACAAPGACSPTASSPAALPGSPRSLDTDQPRRPAGRTAGRRRPRWRSSPRFPDLGDAGRGRSHAARPGAAGALDGDRLPRWRRGGGGHGPRHRRRPRRRTRSRRRPRPRSSTTRRPRRSTRACAGWSTSTAPRRWGWRCAVALPSGPSTPRRSTCSSCRVSPPTPADAAAERLAALLDAHHYADGLGVLATRHPHEQQRRRASRLRAPRRLGERSFAAEWRRRRGARLGAASRCRPPDARPRLRRAADRDDARTDRRRPRR